ncbi:MAG: hypothetical protein C0404_05995 [Verrucomicrobia bacterium]|nr:hypothetical protein [Verrucomicrobiota bacterium]
MKVKCTKCGADILKITASITGGQCMRCFKNIKPMRQQYEEEKAAFKVPPRPTLAEFKAFLAQHSDADIVDQITDRADNKAYYRPESLSVGEITVLTTNMFVGEVENGGVVQYFDNPCGRLAHHLAASFRRVGAHDFASLTEKAVATFTTSRDATSDQWSKDLAKYRASTEAPFKDLEDELWPILTVQKDALFDMVVAYIKKSPGDFI